MKVFIEQKALLQISESQSLLSVLSVLSVDGYARNLNYFYQTEWDLPDLLLRANWLDIVRSQRECGENLLSELSEPTGLI